MNMTVNSFNYVIENGAITGATVAFAGNDSNGQFINAQVKIAVSDLASGQTFLTVTPEDIQKLAETKFKGYADNAFTTTATA
ncbi:hypothetical protein [Liquorilactobacillus nagelii]|jgi:hypothetical protein|uniref:hypothetical protein n=1 Tax=Liquorilactobacillus nagelii TaxID=82688 RepID=UPI00242C56B7|nr:hypothetical protein [Liquorilactobacillus nagelii]MCI1699983.1 hypothetical protein [Liquorilactobacillus nagelii]